MNESPEVEEARLRACALLRSDDWRLTDTARTDGRALGYSQFRMVETILKNLEDGLPFHTVELGEPPGSSGTGYVMNNVDGFGLYIKFILEWDYLKVLSFHLSKHFRSD